MTDTTPQQAISTLAVVGLGYVGLPAAVALADSSLTVDASDDGGVKVAAIREGRDPRGHAALGPSRGSPESFR